MPFRLDPRYGFRAKIQFVTSAAMPNLIYRACLATGTVSNTVYIQRALVAALARDLDLDEADLLAGLPAPRSSAATLHNRVLPVRIGPANTIEEVR